MGQRLVFIGTSGISIPLVGVDFSLMYLRATHRKEKDSFVYPLVHLLAGLRPFAYSDKEDFHLSPPVHRTGARVFQYFPVAIGEARQPVPAVGLYLRGQLRIPGQVEGLEIISTSGACAVFVRSRAGEGVDKDAVHKSSSFIYSGSQIYGLVSAIITNTLLPIRGIINVFRTSSADG